MIILSEKTTKNLEREVECLRAEISNLEDELLSAEFKIDVLEGELEEFKQPRLELETVADAAAQWRDASAGPCKKQAEIGLLDALKEAGF